MHTGRSWDCTIPAEEAIREYREKGFQFCAITDHEVYWDSNELDRKDFLTLSGAESAFLIDEEAPDWLLDRRRWKSLHLNLLWDMEKGENGFLHDQVLKRPLDYGLDSWNCYIDYCKKNNQLVILNHPNWSRLDAEILLGIHGAFAFEIWNTDSILGGGCSSDEALWDYCLNRGKRLWALTGDDTHKYGTDYNICGGAFTMVSAREFTKAGLIRAIKEGRFYPSTGPKIYDMRVVDNVLYMEMDPAVSVRIMGGDYMAKGFTPERGRLIHQIAWEIKKGLKYFRVQIYTPDGKMAWSQPVFPGLWDWGAPALREDPHTPIPIEQIRQQ